jgi:hypothetical protein
MVTCLNCGEKYVLSDLCPKCVSALSPTPADGGLMADIIQRGLSEIYECPDFIRDLIATNRREYEAIARAAQASKPVDQREGRREVAR